MANKITILVSGAPGTGKTVIQQNARRSFEPRLGETAAMGLDDLYMMVDPDWSFHGKAQDACSELARKNAILLAKSLFDAGLQVVVITGNAIHTKTAINAYLSELLPLSDVYHFTLDTEPEEVMRRVQLRGDTDKSLKWLIAWLDLIREHHGPWTEVIDTTALTPSEIMEEMYALLTQGKGRLTGPIS